MKKQIAKTISVVIPTFNCERTIKKCLEAVKWANEVLVIDNNSTDLTPEICSSFTNCRYIPYSTPYPFVALNYGFKEAKGGWIIRIDCDQIISPELSVEIQSIIKDYDTKYDGYYAYGREYMSGKFLEYIFGSRKNPQRDILFKKGMMYYTDLKREHELPKKLGKWGNLKNSFDHLGIPSISDWIEKTNRYTNKDIQRITPEESRAKFRWYKLIILPLYAFFTMYIKNRGFLDGAHGFIYSVLYGFYIYTEQSKLWELKYKSDHGLLDDKE